jgi:1,2-diacylglycerol 3-beta-glucosyltransferase
MLKIAIITPAHNEENTIERCIESVKNLKIPENVELEHVVVADRCTDRTVELCKKNEVMVLEKTFHDQDVWPITETLDYGIKNTSSDLIGKVDADIILEKDWLIKLLPHLDNETISVSSYTITRTGKKWLDFLMWLRDLNYKFAPLGREPRGQARLLNRELLKKIGGLDYSLPTTDTSLDMRIRHCGYKTKLVSNAISIEIRARTLKSTAKHQLSSGKARRKLGISFGRTLAHSVFRFKPFVLLGYLKAYFEEIFP